MFLLQLQLYVLTIIRVTLRRIHKPLGESPHFVSLNIPFLGTGHYLSPGGGGVGGFWGGSLDF